MESVRDDEITLFISVYRNHSPRRVAADVNASDQGPITWYREIVDNVYRSIVVIDKTSTKIRKELTFEIIELPPYESLDPLQTISVEKRVEICVLHKSAIRDSILF